MTTIKQKTTPRDFSNRRWILVFTFAVVVLTLLWRVIDLQVLKKDFLQDQGNARHQRVVTIPAHRGMIGDRNGEALAISTPVDSVWANPQETQITQRELSRLAEVLHLNLDHVLQLLSKHSTREFVYLRRRVNPDIAERVMALNLPGIYLQREYRRYYPAGEVGAHVVGFTNVDDVGQEGIELAYNNWLQGNVGTKRVIQDGRQRIVEDIESIQEMHPGKDLQLSIDRRLQYLAYRELKLAVHANNAVSGSAVILDVHTGEVLALVNQPSYNPNKRKAKSNDRYRNRAVTDVFEPGSAIKPFTVAIALESGKFTPHTDIDTSPGLFRVGANTVRDIHNYGKIDVTRVITKSSNVGASKIALSLDPQYMWSLYNRLGFGTITNSGYPGEAAGLVAHYQRWRKIEQATLAFGYGLSVTPLQLARAYATLAADGVQTPISFLKLRQAPMRERIFSPEVAVQVRRMMETVVSRAGTGLKASVPGYRVAGKTGTVHKSTTNGYASDRYLSVFAGFAPATKPHLAMVVVIDEPRAGQYYGGQVAAPVFSRVMAGALRLLDIAPDNLSILQSQVDKKENKKGRS